MSGERPLTRACRWGAAGGFVPFVAVLWNIGQSGRWNPLRTATANRLNANFYDLQARAIFDGRLAVPPGSLGIEAFVVDGRHYMYFGPFPALLRMPILALTGRLDGRLTAPSMLLGWLVLAAATVTLACRVRTAVRGDAPVGRFEAAAFGVVVFAVCGASPMVFLASQPWVYHEVYVWSGALVIASCAGLIATRQAPSSRHVAVTYLAMTGASLTRLPAGYAVALGAVATGLWLALARRRLPDAAWRRRIGLLLGAAGLAAIAAGSAVNWAKFRHPFRFPIELHEWTRLSAHRKLVLLNNGGRIDGPQFFWTDLVAYLRPDGVRFTPWFPFVSFPAHPQAPVWGVFLDESHRAGSITALTPLLAGLAAWACICAVRRRGPAGIGALRIPLLAALAVTAGVMTFAYVAPRYTADFIPILAVGGMVGVADVARRAVGRSLRWKRIALGAGTLLAAYGMWAHVATGLANAQRVGRGDGLVAWVTTQERLSAATGNPLDAMVRRVDVLPDRAGADELAIVGDCDALYVASGEASGAWIPVAVRPQRFRLTVADDGVTPARAALLMRLRGHVERRLVVQTGLDGRLRLTLVGVPPQASGDWLDVAPGDVVDVTVRGNTARNHYTATATVAGSSEGSSIVRAPLSEWDRQLTTTAISPLVDVNQAAASVAGFSVDHDRGPAPEVCTRLLR